jgi:hypothetical protein
MSPDEKLIAAANSDGTIRFYGTGDGKLQMTLVSTGLEGSALAITPEGKYDINSNKDYALASLRDGRSAKAIDQYPAYRRTLGLFQQFLGSHFAPPSRTN